MLRITLALCLLVFSAQAQSTGQRFFEQHQSALIQRFGRVASAGELQFLLTYILDRQHTEVESNAYFKSKPEPLADLLAKRRGQANIIAITNGLVYPLLRYVLPRSIPQPVLRANASPGERIAAAAHRYLGVRYGPPAYDSRTNQGTLDCSGLVNRVLADAGVLYQRGAGTGATEGLVNSASLQTVTGTPQPGDLLARQHGGRWRHIGIYVGGGYLIEAPYRGTVVRRVIYQPDKWKRTVRF